MAVLGTARAEASAWASPRRWNASPKPCPGAAKARRGYFEQAQGGTLFLDEIGDMPLSMQAKLLRVLQEHRLQRLGGETTIAVDFRLICATHCDLKAMVEEGRFREDLYYRINVIHLRIPPLRERKEDIAWFMQHFIEAFNLTLTPPSNTSRRKARSTRRPARHRKQPCIYAGVGLSRAGGWPAAA